MMLNCCRQPATIFFTIFTAGSLLYKLSFEPFCLPCLRWQNGRGISRKQLVLPYSANCSE